MGEWVAFMSTHSFTDENKAVKAQKISIRTGRIESVCQNKVKICCKGLTKEISLFDIMENEPLEEKDYISKEGESFLYKSDSKDSQYVVGRIVSENYIGGTMWYTGTIEHHPFHLRPADVKGSRRSEGRYLITFPETKATFSTPTFGAPFLDVFIFRMRHNFLGEIFHFRRAKVGFVRERPGESWIAFTESDERGFYLGFPCERYVEIAQNGCNLCLQEYEKPISAPQKGQVVYFKESFTGSKTYVTWFRTIPELDQLILWVQSEGKAKCFAENDVRDLLKRFGKQGTIFRSIMEGYFLDSLNSQNASFFEETRLWQFLN